MNRRTCRFASFENQNQQVRAQVCEQARAGAQASRLPVPPLARSPVHSLVHFDLFIFKANFSPKVGLMRAHVYL